MDDQVIWKMGLLGAGKTTVVEALDKCLQKRGLMRSYNRRFESSQSFRRSGLNEKLCTKQRPVQLDGKRQRLIQHVVYI